MSFSTRFAAAVLIYCFFAYDSLAATVTLTYTPSVVRTQTQGAGTYDVYDFFWTNADGADFTNYTVTGVTTTGTFRDPARLQDDRQINPAAAGQDGNTTGAVDMWANTVWSSAGKIDLGLTATILADPSGYAPTGAGAAPGFTNFKWDVFDNVQGDDNDLSNDADNPTAAAAPYHIMRVLTSVGAVGTINLLAYDTSQPGVAFPFSFFPIPGNTPPTVLPEQPNSHPTFSGDIITTQFEATDAETPLGPFTFSNAVLASYVPLFPGIPNNPPFNGTVDSDGTFTWDTTGFRFGVYTINVTATDPGGASASGGGYVVILFMPEPSTASLCMMAFLGMSTVNRRRGGKSKNLQLAIEDNK